MNYTKLITVSQNIHRKGQWDMAKVKNKILLKLSEMAFLYKWKYKIAYRWKSVKMRKKLAEEYQH